MKKLRDNVAKFISGVNYVSLAVCFIMVFMVAIDVILRKLKLGNINGSNELTTYFMVVLVVLGIPTLQIKDGHVIIYNTEHPDGFTLDESYLPAGLQTDDTGGNKIEVGANEYFVLGDNRGNSKDSRYFGAVDKSFVTGKVLLRGWPLSRLAIFDSKTWPQYK